LTDSVVLVGLGERFQIWGREAFLAERPAQRLVAQQGLRARAEARRTQLGGGG